MLINATLCEVAYFVKANPHTVSDYANRMPKRSLQQVVATNAKALRVANKQTQPDVVAAAKLKGYKIDQGTISRIERLELNPSLDVLEALSVGLGCESWQLLTRNYDAKNPPILKEASAVEKELWKRIQESAKNIGL